MDFIFPNSSNILGGSALSLFTICSAITGANILPFLWFAESLNIPWLILSDSEDIIVKSVKEQFRKSNSSKEESDVIVFLDDDNDFEKQLVADGFQDEIRKSIASFDSYDNEQHREAKESQRLAEIETFFLMNYLF
jgi:putative ATP-dependent endonuclease of OLD family